MFGLQGNKVIKNEDVEVVKEVGSGTFGTVYHGKWQGQNVAVKRMKAGGFSENSSEAEQQKREFMQEADMLSKLRHPNVVLFHGVILDGPEGTPATVTHYLQHGTLRDVLRSNNGPLTRRQQLFLATDVASGMDFLHSKNIVHFDLKSPNLFVNMRDPQHPRCVIGDLGLSVIKRNATVSAGVRGSIPWMAPELLKGRLVSEKVDVYAFGIVLWEIVVGRVPYAGMSRNAIIEGVVDNTLRPTVPSSCEPELRKLMEQCWSGDRWARPSFNKIARALRSMRDKADDEDDDEDEDGDDDEDEDDDDDGAESRLSVSKGKNISGVHFDQHTDSNIYGIHGSIISGVGHGQTDQNDVHQKPSEADIYGVGPSITSYGQGRNMQDDHQKHGESAIYGIGASINANEQGRNMQDILQNVTTESVSDIYGIEATFKQENVHEEAKVSEADIYNIEASNV